ncbi:MAG: hypothetical protein QOJ59_795, partial [Thermomicrobiales bacterium]|nr:hypothetical protein [Thermomicrobiales bacterium]
RLADAVDADDHDDEWDAALEDLDPAIAGGELEELDHLQSENLAGIGRVFDAVAVDALAELADEALADVPTDVGLDEEHLEVFVELVVEDATVEETRDLAEDATACLFETFFELDVGLGTASEEATKDQRCYSKQGA